VVDCWSTRSSWTCSRLTSRSSICRRRITAPPIASRPTASAPTASAPTRPPRPDPVAPTRPGRPDLTAGSCTVAGRRRRRWGAGRRRSVVRRVAMAELPLPREWRTPPRMPPPRRGGGRDRGPGGAASAARTVPRPAHADAVPLGAAGPSPGRLPDGPAALTDQQSALLAAGNRVGHPRGWREAARHRGCRRADTKPKYTRPLGSVAASCLSTRSGRTRSGRTPASATYERGNVPPRAAGRSPRAARACCGVHVRAPGAVPRSAVSDATTPARLNRCTAQPTRPGAGGRHTRASPASDVMSVDRSLWGGVTV
jgi:hypothetical protein